MPTELISPKHAADAVLATAPRFTVADPLHWTAITAIVAGLSRAALFIYGGTIQVGLGWAIVVLLCAALVPRRPGATTADELISAIKWVLACWLGAAALGIGLPFVLPLAVGATLGRRWYLATGLIIAFSPFTLGVLAGVWDYWQGEARLQRSRYRSHEEFPNPDFELRCWRRSNISCIHTGFEYIHEPTYDAGVRAMSNLFGYMPGAYTGPYPTEAEAKAAIQNAKPVNQMQLVNDELLIDGQRFKLDQGVGSALLEHEQVRYSWWQSPDKHAIRAAIWQQHCLLLHLPLYTSIGDTTSATTAPPAIIVAICRKEGRPFAYYAEGDVSPKFLLVRWQK